jgi:ubiquitin carboxyl-terminal hydrolase 34
MSAPGLIFCETNLNFFFRSDDMDASVEDIGGRSCVTRFVRTLLLIMEHGVKPHSKHLTEYFAFLYEFAKMGEEEVSISLAYFLNYVPIFSI